MIKGNRLIKNQYQFQQKYKKLLKNYLSDKNAVTEICL